MVDDGSLFERLEGLRPIARAVFAAACAERLLPAYWCFHEVTGRGQPELLSEHLDCLWRDLDGSPVRDLQRRAAAALELVPHEDEPWSELLPYAQNAAAAVTYAIRTRLASDPQDAVWAACQVHEALDRMITNAGTIETTEYLDEGQIASDPWYRAEAGRQERDLRELAAAAEAHFAGRFRDRARMEAFRGFDLGCA